jgi:type II secretory pathway component PulF
MNLLLTMQDLDMDMANFDFGDLGEKFATWRAKNAFNAKARAAMYEDLAAFIAAGMPPFEAVRGILEVHELRDHPLVAMTRAMSHGMASGQSLAEVLQPWADPAEVAMIGAGERSGALEKALRETSELTRARHDMLVHVRSKLTMPSIQILATFGLVYYIASTVVPAAKRLLPEKYMPGFAKGYFAFGDGFIQLGPWIGLAFIALMVLIFATMHTWTGEHRDRADRWFPWIAFRGLQNAFFLITVSAMMRSGMPMQLALSEMERFAKPWLKEHIQRMMERLGKGKRETVAMDTGFLLDDISDRLQIYSRLPNFTVVMENLGRDAMANIRQGMDQMASRINVVVMVIIAVFIVSTIFALGETSFAISDAVEKRSRGF